MKIFMDLYHVEIQIILQIICLLNINGFLRNTVNLTNTVIRFEYILVSSQNHY